jgi:hypothetical protein
MHVSKLISGTAFLAWIAWAACVTNATAETAVTDKGRYTMTPVEGGFMRLDTETGSVALCTRKGETWSCEPVSDKSGSNSGTNENASKLEAENKALKERLKNLEAPGATPPADTLPAPAETPPGGVSKLPTEKEVDEALDYVERMYKKFRDRLQKIGPPPGTPAPETPAPKPGDSGAGAL